MGNEVERDIALFAHGHVRRVLAARRTYMPFLLDTGTLCVLGYYRKFLPRGFEMDPSSANPNDWSWSLLTMTKTRSGRKRKGSRHE